MEINANTKIDDLLKEYPFWEDFLVKLSAKFKGLRNPIMRKTIGKVATLSKVAGIGDLDLDKFLSVLTAEINRQTGSDAKPDEFWIELGGKFIYIRYFAVWDKTGYYRGCLEVSQDLTRIRKLEGQQRLLDWE